MKVTAIDVSYCQTGVDYNKVKNSGIDAVIIRAGFGKEIYQKDSEFETHYRNAKKAGLAVGVYWYSYAYSVAEAKQEAKVCLACIKGKTLELPVYYDLEESGQTRLGMSALTNIAIVFAKLSNQVVTVQACTAILTGLTITLIMKGSGVSTAFGSHNGHHPQVKAVISGKMPITAESAVSMVMLIPMLSSTRISLKNQIQE